MPELNIRKVIEQVTSGQLRIPAFQRGFVWDADMVAHFMDSIYKEFPFGSILLWRTKEQLRHERNIGTFQLPDPEKDYPIDYILDGQQRITSIFGVFQASLNREFSELWTKIYFDFNSDPDAQESNFLPLEDDQVDWTRHFPLSALFDTVGYRIATDKLNNNLKIMADRLQERFKEAIIPVQSISTDDRATVAIVFERVNRKGVPLETLDLLAAWTWSDEFDLHRKFDELAAKIEPYGFKDLGEDTNLILRCCAAVVAGDASPGTLVSLNGSTVRERFQEVVNGIKGAIDFLKGELRVYALDNLPYLTLIVPLTVFFALPGTKQHQYSDAQRRALVRWFWRSCFSSRYSSGVLRNLKADIEEMTKLKKGESSKLGDFGASVSAAFFSNNTFRIDTVNTKTFVLLLAQKDPLSFVSGALVDLGKVLRDSNRNEFHHIFPKAHLQTVDAEIAHSRLVNFCFMSRSDNNALGGSAPSLYRAKMPSDISAILKHACLPESLFTDDYLKFVEERSDMLVLEAQNLIT